MVPPGDVDALADRIRDVVVDPARMTRMSGGNIIRAKRLPVRVLPGELASIASSARPRSVGCAIGSRHALPWDDDSDGLACRAGAADMFGRCERRLFLFTRAGVFSGRRARFWHAAADLRALRQVGAR
ncbi:MAG: hypothetical protein Q7S35_06270 [Candidatus Limnocylindrales bacterium]|nr:hypothetical protein [Candidatus Limnocylindrales bacterium]